MSGHALAPFSSLKFASVTWHLLLNTLHWQSVISVINPTPHRRFVFCPNLCKRGVTQSALSAVRDKSLGVTIIAKNICSRFLLCKIEPAYRSKTQQSRCPLRRRITKGERQRHPLFNVGMFARKVGIWTSGSLVNHVVAYIFFVETSKNGGKGHFFSRQSRFCSCYVIFVTGIRPSKNSGVAIRYVRQR